VVKMSDILIRDVPEATVAEIDRRARDLGVSRNEYLRRWLDGEMRATQPVTPEDLRRVGRLARDLADPEVMREAWS
jgi:Ribbon-helix-helix protein, copG family